MFIELTQFYYHTCNKNIPLIITILKSYKTVALRDVQDLNPKKEITVLKGPTNWKTLQKTSKIVATDNKLLKKHLVTLE